MNKAFVRESEPDGRAYVHSVDHSESQWVDRHWIITYFPIIERS